MDDEGYVFVGTPSPNIPPSQATTILFSQPGPRRSFQEWVVRLVDRFIVRGTRSPIQWILDLRTYRLKIYYNSTTPGHIKWMGQDRLCYKELSFTMGQFKGFIHQLVSDTRRVLLKELIFADGIAMPPIP
ncbi:unnamed protein product [Penicillium salamii]|uniref:Uncharacterized protein n=1 Tax=Penicillium salamii TaxID=1612424 RepID=A0A9W4N799_9EURO|nr:unnamed protein product [Penicillium salamii]